MALAADIDDPRCALCGAGGRCCCAELGEEQMCEVEGPEVVGEELEVDDGVAWCFDLISVHVAYAGVIYENCLPY